MIYRRCRPRERQVALCHYRDKPVRPLDLGEDVNDMVALLDLAATVSRFCPRPLLPRCAFGTDPIQVVGGGSLPSVNLVTEFALSGRQSLSTWR
jgi:hypothetical protein